MGVCKAEHQVGGEWYSLVLPAQLLTSNSKKACVLLGYSTKVGNESSGKNFHSERDRLRPHYPILSPEIITVDEVKCITQGE